MTKRHIKKMGNDMEITSFSTLLKFYPDLFDPNAEINVDDGWLTIVVAFVDELLTIRSTLAPEQQEECKIRTIEDRGSGMEITMSASGDNMRLAAEKACEASLVVCERCGSDGSRTDVRGTTLTLCSKCAREKGV